MNKIASLEQLATRAVIAQTEGNTKAAVKCIRQSTRIYGPSATESMLRKIEWLLVDEGLHRKEN